MDRLRFRVDGEAVVSVLAPFRSGTAVLVPLDRFAEAVRAEVQDIGSGGNIALCRGDRCVPVEAGARREIDGSVYVDLAALGEALGLAWTMDEKELRVDTKEAQDSEEIGVGRKAPGFTLPDMFTGEPVSTESFLRRKTVFFMWASW